MRAEILSLEEIKPIALAIKHNPETDTMQKASAH